MRIKNGFRLRNVMGHATIVGEGVDQVNFNKLVTLNGTAEYLWTSVEGKEFDVQHLAGLLMEKYGIDEELADKDAEAIAKQWNEVGLTEL
jgi:hypothetical protein